MASRIREAPRDEQVSKEDFKKQVAEAIKAVAQTLENTPAVCRRSYVHPAVLTAFEMGMLREFAQVLKAARSQAPSQNAVGAVLEITAA